MKLCKMKHLSKWGYLITGAVHNACLSWEKDCPYLSVHENLELSFVRLTKGEEI